MGRPRAASPTESVGVSLVRLAVAGDLGWEFRELGGHDYGIDGCIEIIEGQSPTGRLIALQIKAGRSYFAGATAQGFPYSICSAHLRYWLDHSLPVVLVLCDPTQGICYWEHVTESNLRRLPSGRWQIVVPRDQVLAEASAAQLRAVASDRSEVRMALSRPFALDELTRESVGRCIVRWMAAGTSREVASALASDPRIGEPGEWYSSQCDTPVVVLEGEPGAGKSLIAERLFQSAIREAQQAEQSHIPVYLADKVLRLSVGNLRDVVAIRTSRIGTAGQAAFVVLDGLDELGWDAAMRLLDEARVLVHTWPSTRVVVTSRPLPGVKGDGLRVLNVPPLSEDASYHVVARAAGENGSVEQVRRIKHVVQSLPSSLRAAVRLPLFALLLGVSLREDWGIAPQSKGEMISRVSRQALRGVTADVAEASPLLAKLAALTTSAAAAVHVSELGGPAEARPLVDSRLVAEKDGGMDFVLPVFREWFAAESLRAGTPPPEDLVNESAQLERWRYPLVVLAATASHDVVSRYLGPIAEERPAFAAEIVRDSLVGMGRGRRMALPSWQECGRRLRCAMQSWANGIGPLAKLVAPVWQDGTVRPVYTAIRNGRLIYAWHWSGETPDDVMPLPQGQELDRLKTGGITSAVPGHQSAWAWRWAHRELASSVSRLLRGQRLPIESGPLAEEKAWVAATALAGKRSSWDQSLPFEDLERHIRAIESRLTPEQRQGSISISAGRGKATCDLRWLQRYLERMRARGTSSLGSPWPGDDHDRMQYGLWVWSSYSDQALLRRAERVYLGAMEGYRQLVETWFPTFSEDLATYAIMPARLVGLLRPPKSPVGPPSDTDPLMGWYLEALPRGSENCVSIRLGEEMPPADEIFALLQENRRPQRPQGRWSYLSYHGLGMLDIFGPTPATDLAYKWLHDDLTRINWIGGL